MGRDKIVPLVLSMAIIKKKFKMLIQAAFVAFTDTCCVPTETVWQCASLPRATGSVVCMASLHKIADSWEDLSAIFSALA